MTVLADHVDERSEAYQANRAHLLVLLAEHDRQLALVNDGGGEKYVARHRQRGKLLARERVERLVDRDSPLLELSPLAAWGTDFPVGAGLFTGVGVIEDTECVIIANDPTVRGGTSTVATLRKNLRAMEIARQNRLPVVNLVESGGADLPHQSEIFIPGGQGFHDITTALGARCADDRHRVRQLDGRRGVRAGHERLRRDDRPAIQGVPRRTAVGEDGHGRGE